MKQFIHFLYTLWLFGSAQRKIQYNEKLIEKYRSAAERERLDRIRNPRKYLTAEN